MKITVKDIAQIALFAALTAVGAFVKVPLPYVSFTMQDFFVLMSGFLLGAKKGALSQLVYVAIGLVGVPVFSEGGGIGYVLKPSFGYLVGFVLASFLTGLISERMKKKTLIKTYLAMLAGLAVIYVIGVIYLFMIKNFYVGKDFPIGMAIKYGFLMFIGGDLVSTFIASIICSKLYPILERNGLLAGKRAEA